LTLKSGNESERLVTLIKSKVYSDSDVIKAAVLAQQIENLNNEK